MVENYRNILKKYFEDYSLVESNINSFNRFMDKGIQQIVNETQDIIPTIIPQEVSDFKIKLGKVEISKPRLVEADGSKRDVYPMEARMRKLTYSSPIMINISVFVEGVEKESFKTLIGKIPVMVRSKYCHLWGQNKEGLVKYHEDPNDLGGYFILNGNERVLIIVEDLASNKLFVERSKVGPSKFVGKIFSETNSYRIPHTLEQMKDGVIYMTFTRFRRIPIILLLRALGLTRDNEIRDMITKDTFYDDDLFINLYEGKDIKTQKEAAEVVAKKIGIPQIEEDSSERVLEMLDRYFLPHIGTKKEDRISKAHNLCKYIKRFMAISKGEASVSNKDHYANKRLKLSGDLLADLFRVNLRALVQDIVYNFQRLVKRGKFQSMKIIIRDQLLTNRIKSAMATGSWVGGRKGISQNIDRTNFIATVSHLQKVVSLLSSSQENFEARTLNPTHWGRLCPVETPEGTPIGLRKNLSITSEISVECSQLDKLKKTLAGYGLEDG
ncbi:MAG: DNA-directed RNA polymerase subunit B'' [Nanoarchaeota archaeon]|nr:DNA-directed RNA polymerase subunit B'' [Nanoarchaeota archaeon]